QHLSNIVGQHAEEALYHLRASRKAHAQLLILGGNPNWAGIQMALSGHHASDRQQRCSSEAEFLRTQQGRNHYIACKFEATIHAQTDPRPQSRSEERVMGVAQADLPRQASVLDRSQRRCPGAPIVTADGDNVSPGLRYARSNDSHTRAGDKLYSNPRPRIYCAQIVNQLRQVFDAVDVVM